MPQVAQGPWTDFQKPKAAGPWDDYATTETPSTTVSDIQAIIDRKGQAAKYGPSSPRPSLLSELPGQTLQRMREVGKPLSDALDVLSAPLAKADRAINSVIPLGLKGIIGGPQESMITGSADVPLASYAAMEAVPAIVKKLPEPLMTGAASARKLVSELPGSVPTNLAGLGKAAIRPIVNTGARLVEELAGLLSSRDVPAPLNVPPTPAPFEVPVPTEPPMQAVGSDATQGVVGGKIKAVPSGGSNRPRVIENRPPVAPVVSEEPPTVRRIPGQPYVKPSILAQDTQRWIDEQDAARDPGWLQGVDTKPPVSAYSISPTPGKQIFARFHFDNEKFPFSADNASSAPWGESDGPRTRGYSSFTGDTAGEAIERVHKYFENRGGMPDGTIHVYEGDELGRGPDNEPLSVPRRVISSFPSSQTEAVLSGDRSLPKPPIPANIKLGPATPRPSSLDPAAVNKWMNVPAKEVLSGANPGQQLIDEKLIGETKELTKANVKSALADAGKEMQSRLEAADKAGVTFDVQTPVYDHTTTAVKRIGSPRDAAFQAQMNGIVDDIESKYPDLHKLTPSQAHALKVELGDSIQWSGAGYDTPANQAMVSIYRDLNKMIKNGVEGIGPTQQRWGNLYVASKNLSNSLAKDIVGSGTGTAPPAVRPSLSSEIPIRKP